MTETQDRQHFPSDRELDEIKQLLGMRTIHLQLGCNPDDVSSVTNPFVSRVTGRMLDIFGAYALNQAAYSTSGAYQSMYDTALMRIWWEEYGEVQRGRPGSQEQR